jgi:TolB protein
MRLTSTLGSARLRRGASLAAFVAVGGAMAFPAPTQAQAPPGPQPSAPAANPQDPLGNLVVTPGASRPLPKIGVARSLSSDLADVIVHGVVERDLDLSGEVEIVPDNTSPLDTSDTGVDLEAWAKRGVSAVIDLSGTTAGDQVTLGGKLYFVKKGGDPVFEQKTTTAAARLRPEAHRLSDQLIGALTGKNGSFYSHMTFTAQSGPLHTAYVIDADGHDVQSVSGVDELAIAAAFGKSETLYWVSSTNDDPYQIRSRNGAVTLPIKGSVYGLAWSKDRSKVAVSIGTDVGIYAFVGPDFAGINLVSPIPSAIEPAFTPSGKLVFSGAGRYGQRIYVDGKPISPDGIPAVSPTVCDHPDGVKIVFAAGPGARTDLVATGENGGPLVRLTAGQGSNGAPACSPDGRLVAFFSTRTTGDGPGLYVMRVDGQHARRISTFVGDSLRWDPLPQPPPAPAPPPAAPAPPQPAPR